MLTRLASLALERRRLVLTLAVLGFVLITALCAPVMGMLSAGGYDDPKSESTLAATSLRERFNAGDPNFILLATPDRSVDDPAAVEAGRALTAKLKGEDGVASVTSYWGEGTSPDLRSKDGRSALVLARLSGDESAVEKAAKRIAPQVTGAQGALRVKSGGAAEFNRQANDRVGVDLTKAEGIAVPITLVLLVVVFGSGIAALLPLAVAGVSVVGSLAVLRVIAEFTPVSVFATNLTTALGLGLAIDYSLFIVSRYRQERALGRETAAALRTSLVTSGRTVLFSSLTVLLSLCALLVFPLYYLRSFAYAGIGVVVFAMIGSLVVLPALLAAIGPRIDRFDPLAKARRRRAARAAANPGHGVWHRLATAVMKRPWPVLVVVVLGLAVLVLPFAKASFGLPDDRALPKDMAAAEVGSAIRDDFPALAGQGLQVTLTGGRPDTSQLGSYAEQLSRVPGVARVDTATGSYRSGRQSAPAVPGAEAMFTKDGDAWLSLTSNAEAYSRSGQDMVTGVRAVTPPAGATARAAGPAAAYSDTLDSLWSALPYAALIIAVTTFVLLFLFTGSVLIPVKAIVLNLLSLTATFGAMVYVFQDGHLKWLVGDFTDTGQIDVTMPILMFCVIFGLSMDYEVFLLSRIREEYDRTGDNRTAVAAGLESTGSLISAAAGLMAIFFIALISVGFTPVKVLGLGTALAIVTDAVIIRGLLVPAFMRLAGRANWWAPGPLRRLYERLGFRHDEHPAPEEAALQPAVR
ncbi:MMPL family transporter [Streptomyces violascens]|uniref:MMPL family transporter n=1 Tax=Streptomyces violascens TaxID=67381 RepID=UPI00379D7F6B